MSIESISVWLISLLKRRGLDRADGRLLFAYDLSEDEHASLGRVLTSAITDAGGIEAVAIRCLGRTPALAPPAAFVLFAAEWWKREYEGGVWDWSPIIEKLDTDPESFPAQLRSEFVARGLSFWQLSPLSSGKRFIGSIVVNGGIPMRLLAHGAGPLATVLNQLLALASRFRWGRTQLLEAALERQIYLPTAYRRPEISELLVQFVEAVLQLKEEYQLEGLSDPTARLDEVAPAWRRKFPVALASEAAQALLTGLVREAAAQKSETEKGQFQVERRMLRDAISGSYFIESHASHATRASAEDLAGLFGFTDVDHLPRYFSVDLETDVRRPFVDGRLVLGAENPVANLSGRKLVLKGKAALAEHTLVLRAQIGDIGERVTMPGGSALPDEDPWLFVEGDAGQLVFVAAGGARLPQSAAWVALPTAWSFETDATSPAEDVGELILISGSARRVFHLRADARLSLDDLHYRVRLKQMSHAAQIYQWKGMRLPEARGRAVFRNRQAPRLYRTAELTLVKVPTSDQEWHRRGAQDVVTPKEAYGPVEVRILDDGELLARHRIFVLKPDARIEYTSGEALGTGAVRFINWGPIDLAADPLAGVSAEVSTSATTTCIELSSTVAPPAEIKVRIRWRGTPGELSLVLPYPVSGGRFLRASGAVAQPDEPVPLRDLIGMRLQVFDTNPARPQRYALQLALGKGGRQVSTQYPIKVDAGGRAEVRLLEYQRQIESLLGLFDDLDANVTAALLVGGHGTTRIQVRRYAASLVRDESSVSFSESSKELLSERDLICTRAVASPLNLRGGVVHELPPMESGGTQAGAWDTSGLDLKQSPWLIYPAEESAVLFRPMALAMPADAELDLAAVEAGAVPACLDEAMLEPHPLERWKQMHSVMLNMSEDLQHVSWPMLDAAWQTFHHLPLTALDVWRVVAKQPKAVLAFLLRSELPDADLAEALRRFRNETGWIPELTTIADLLAGSRALWRFWSSQGLAPERARKYFDEELERRFKLLAAEIPSLEPLLDAVLLAATGQASDLLLEVARLRTGDLLKSLWDGADSLVNSQLFLVNSERSDWPCRDFVERLALPALLQNCPTSLGGALAPHLDKLFWSFGAWRRYFGRQFSVNAQPDFKFSAANLPVLCALWSATSTSRQWWSDPHHRLALRQIRDFDPVWFEQAYRHASKALMSINGFIQLGQITEQ